MQFCWAEASLKRQNKVDRKESGRDRIPHVFKEKKTRHFMHETVLDPKTSCTHRGTNMYRDVIDTESPMNQ